MDWTTGMKNAIDYIENNITEELDYDEIAKQCCSSKYNFQRVFGILCGCTIGEYIRSRRLSLAGAELALGKIKVIDAALKYGYESPDSFAKAFCKFHGILPSQARGNGEILRSYSRLHIKFTLEGGESMNYKIEEKAEMLLTGFKKRFEGHPNDRNRQDHNFAVSTRLNQLLLHGEARDCETTYEVLTNFDKDGYDFYIASKMDPLEHEDFPDDIGPELYSRFEDIIIPAGTYLICETERCKYPCDKIDELRKKAVSELLPSLGYELREAPEVGIIHWFYEYQNEELNNSRYYELCLPVVKK